MERAKLAKDYKIPVTPEFRDLIRRRTLPFLDSIGLDRPISFVLEEVYVQGIKDALQAMEERRA